MTSLSMNSKDTGMWPACNQFKAAENYFTRLPEDTGKEMCKTYSSYKQDSEKGSGAPEKSLANQRNGVSPGPQKLQFAVSYLRFRETITHLHICSLGYRLALYPHICTATSGPQTVWWEEHWENTNGVSEVA